MGDVIAVFNSKNGNRNCLIIGGNEADMQEVSKIIGQQVKQYELMVDTSKQATCDKMWDVLINAMRHIEFGNE